MLRIPDYKPEAVLALLPAVIAAAALSLSSCTREPTDAEDFLSSLNFQSKLSVFGLISSQEFIHTVTVERTLHPIESGTKAIISPEVYLTTGGNKTRLRSQQNVKNLFWTSQLECPVLPGRVVELEVIWDPNKDLPSAQDTTGGKEKLPVQHLTAKTVPPGRFAITSPASGLDTTKTEELTVTWSISPFAYGYIVYAMNAVATLNRTYTSTTRDTTITIPYLFNSQGKYNIEVWAVDKNYYEYYLSRPNDPFIEIPRLVDGGYGVFGSFTRSRISIHIKDELILLGRKAGRQPDTEATGRRKGR